MVDEIDDMKIGAGQYHSCLIAQIKQRENDINRLYVWGLNNEG